MDDKIELVAKLVKSGLLTREEGLLQFGISLSSPSVPLVEPPKQNLIPSVTNVEGLLRERLEFDPGIITAGWEIYEAFKHLGLTQQKLTRVVNDLRIPHVQYTSIRDKKGKRCKGFRNLKLK